MPAQISGSGIPLIFLHLSDIHFNVPKGGDIYELDADLRNELEIDAAARANELGAPTAILVTGDVAFSGSPDEYKIAKNWLLNTLCPRVGCPGGESVYCIPGNHDVDRSVIKKSRPIRDCHTSLRNCSTRDLHQTILEYLESPEVFYAPLENYNQFAMVFECDLSKATPYWEDDFQLNDGSILRIRGMNSTLVSDAADDKDSRATKLIVGQHQCQLKSESGVEYMSMCHHPPDWLIDQEEVEGWLDRRARIQLYGHKHVHRLRLADGRLRIAAGAVHPDRGESDWKPRYNWMTMYVDGSGDQRKLVTTVHPRVWSDDERRFVDDYATCEGRKSTTFRLPIASWHLPNAPGRGASVNVAECSSSRAPKIEARPPAPSNAKGVTMDPARTLAHRFLSLSFLRRMEVARALNLLREEDEGLTERERSKQVFLRAKDGGFLKQLWDEVEKRREGGNQDQNPFA